jgi:hypothetical protein
MLRPLTQRALSLSLSLSHTHTHTHTHKEDKGRGQHDARHLRLEVRKDLGFSVWGSGFEV